MSDTGNFSQGAPLLADVLKICIVEILNAPFFIMLKLRALLRAVGILPVYELPGITISIGNINLGGTGKSPVVIALANYVRNHGGKPVILTRGYRSGVRRGQFVAIKDGAIANSHGITGPIFPDEARMQSVECPGVPVVVSPSRFRAAKWYLAMAAELPTHWILDDGFQHLQLVRQVDIVLLDAHKPFENLLTLPFGRLREHPRALDRAHAVIVAARSRSDLEIDLEVSLRKYFNGSIWYCFFVQEMPVSARTPPLIVDPSMYNNVFLTAGIARPDRFLAGIEQFGLHVRRKYFVADHERFDRDILKAGCNGCDAVITTAKDYWREPDVFLNLPIPVFVSKIYPQGLDQAFSSILELAK